MSLDGMLDPQIGDAIEPMTAALHHRGPDGSGIFRDACAALGHRRLAIIDRAGGAQPITNEDSTCWLVFNGEIYNHRSLRQTLIGRGHRYRTVSDTETIIHAYEEYGPACVEHLEGMFAFAIYDQPKRELFIARDRLGKKPLFYASLGNALIFASEMKAFYRNPAWNDDIDQSCLESYFALGYFVAPQTVYRHVRKLLPGHYLRVRNGKVETREYWDVTEFDLDHRDESTVLSDLERLIGTAVSDRLESEVPLGSFLSGGIDSGLVTSFMGGNNGLPVITTSVGFVDKAHDELDAAAITARHLHTKHYACTIEPRLDEILDPVVSAFDEPFADSSAIPTYYVSKAAREHVTVALSGDGGDETFAGYDFRYVPHAMEAAVRAWIPGAPGRAAVRGFAAVWPRSGKLPRPLRLGPIADNLLRDPAEAYLSDLCFMKPAAVRRLLGTAAPADVTGNDAFERVISTYRNCPSSDALQRAQYADLKIYMPNGPLVKVDRMSMLHSLEVRCPLLDRRVVEFAFRLPAHRKMPRFRSKHLLRQLAARRLPASISRLPKRGFTAPVAQWLAGAGAEHFSDEVFGRQSACASMLDVAWVKELYSEHRRHVADHSYSLWAVWMLEHWARTRRNAAPCVTR